MKNSKRAELYCLNCKFYHLSFSAVYPVREVLYSRFTVVPWFSPIFSITVLKSNWTFFYQSKRDGKRPLVHWKRIRQKDTLFVQYASQLLSRVIWDLSNVVQNGQAVFLIDRQLASSFFLLRGAFLLLHLLRIVYWSFITTLAQQPLSR